MSAFSLSRAILVSILLMSFILNSPNIEAQELEYSFGIVKGVSQAQLVVSEYDYGEDREVDISYVITPEIKIENVDSIGAIEIGDEVEIEYVVESGKNIIKTVSVYKSSGEETEMEGETETEVETEEDVYY